MKFRAMTPDERAEELECYGMTEDDVENDGDGEGDYVEVLDVIENGTSGDDDYSVDEKLTKIYLQMKVKVDEDV